MARRKAMRRRKKASRSNFATALRRLKSLKSSKRQQAISMANNSFIRQFCKELKKLRNKKLTPKKKRSLQKYTKQLRQLVNAKTPISKRRHILSQKGGGILKAILSSIPVVGNVLNAINAL